MLLDVATGQDTPVPEGIGALPLDDQLLYGEKDSAGIRCYYVVDLLSMVAVRLGPLPGGSEALVGHVREAESIYALKTGADKYRLLLLTRKSDGSVSQGYYVEDVRNLDTLLAGVRYGTPPRVPPCPLDQEVFSPNGQYYYVESEELRIYSPQGELLNSISGKYLHCYGWAWDSSGVYVQERRGGPTHDIGALQLLLAEP
jgi:hypothetical protein